MARVLVLGTKNQKKRNELLDLLGLPEIELKTLAEFPPLPEVIEDGESFLENATKKAVEVARSLGCWTLGEDSGLAVDALGGKPGIFSARWSGEPCDDERNNDKLLRELEGVPPERRSAHYVCASVVADPDGNVRASAEGRCEGRITTHRRGTGGFGYDPLFLIVDQGKTFGELPISFKHQRSHRAAAVALLKPQLSALIQRGIW
ncbi:MAG: non-canonical purine NTP pyrophosphatase [Planctomycetota bacterium]